MTRRLDLGLALALVAACASFRLALAAPVFLNLYWQLTDGAQILAGHVPATVAYAIASGPLVAQEWLYECELAWVAAHWGYGAHLVLCALAAAATPLLAFAAARRSGVPSTAAGIAALLTIGGRFVGVAVRPETFAVDAFALVLCFLPGRRLRWAAIPVVALWANLHASVLLAPVALAAFACGELVRGRRRRGYELAALTLCAALATLLTPYGIRLWSYAVTLALAPSVERATLSAWRPFSFTDPNGVLAVVPGLAVLALCGVVLRRRWSGELLLAAFCFALTLTHVRYATFLCVAWTTPLGRALARRASGVLDERRPVPAVALSVVLFWAIVPVVPALRTPVDAPGPWQTAAAIVARHHLAGNAYVEYAWGAYLHWRGLPLRPLIDAHGDPYPNTVWAEHLTLLHAADGWRDVLRRRAIGVVIVAAGTPLARVLERDRSWRTVSVDGGVAAFERTPLVGSLGSARLPDARCARGVKGPEPPTYPGC